MDRKQRNKLFAQKCKKAADEAAYDEHERFLEENKDKIMEYIKFHTKVR